MDKNFNLPNREKNLTKKTGELENGTNEQEAIEREIKVINLEKELKQLENQSIDEHEMIKEYIRDYDDKMKQLWQDLLEDKKITASEFSGMRFTLEKTRDSDLEALKIRCGVIKKHKIEALKSEIESLQ